MHWDRLFLVVGLAGLDTFNVQATLLCVDAEDRTGQGFVVALATVALATVGLVATVT